MIRDFSKRNPSSSIPKADEVLACRFDLQGGNTLAFKRTIRTTPSALKFQINRCDIFGVDASSVSFPAADTDYAGGCGYVDINIAPN